MIVRTTLTVLALSAMASPAIASIPDPATSWATVANPPAVILVAPGGHDSFVYPYNHTIDVYVRDSNNLPVELIASDIWLENDAAAPCPGGWIADSSTYAPDPGHTTFTGTPRGGIMLNIGCRNHVTEVFVIGIPIETLDLRFVSPDLNGDGHVTLQDFGLFASCYQWHCTDQCWCADLSRSDEPYPQSCVTIADFAIFAVSYLLSDCP